MIPLVDVRRLDVCSGNCLLRVRRIGKRVVSKNSDRWYVVGEIGSGGFAVQSLRRGGGLQRECVDLNSAVVLTHAGKLTTVNLCRPAGPRSESVGMEMVECLLVSV